MANNIAFAKNYAGILDEVYQRASVSAVLNRGCRMVRAGRSANEKTPASVRKPAHAFLERATGLEPADVSLGS